MDEIRCPMCGNLNPPELEECQYCQARLTPLIMSQPPGDDMDEDEKTPQASGEDEGFPEWLQDLRMEEEGGSDQESVEIEGETPFEEEGEADWLARLRDQSLVGDEEGEAEGPEAEPFGEIFSPSPPDGAESGVESAIDEEDLAPESQEADIGLPAGLESSDEDELPDWLSEISPVAELSDQLEGEFEMPEHETLSPEEELIPESQEADIGLPAGLEPSDEDELPEWLSEIRPEADQSDQSKGEFEMPEHEPPSREEELIPERQEAEIDLPAGLEPLDEDELPEWLSEIRPDADQSDQSEDEFEVPEHGLPSHEEETLPDWMAELEPDELHEPPDWAPEVEIDTKASDAEEIEDEGLPEADDDEPTEDEPGEPPAEEDQPEWLKRIEEEQAERVPPFKEEIKTEADQPAVDGEQLPDWMVELETDEVDEVEEEEVEQLPDWLAASEAGTELEEEEDLPEWLAPAAVEEGAAGAVQDEAPVWMADLEAVEIEEAVDSTVEEYVGDIEEEGVPEWLTELEQESVSAFVIDGEDEEEVEGEEVEELPISADEEGEEILEPLPEWADDVSIEEEVEEVGEPELEEAELPSWLEAMRPVEVVAPDVSDKESVGDVVETIGPLAGLSGVLAAETDFARVRKPPTYSVKLRVTENQQARVTLLREMLSTEDKQKALPAQPVITPQYIFRLVIALALILPILWAVVSGGTLTPLPEPENVPSGVLDVRTQIESQLFTNSPVLVAFDYEAGFSSELDIPASAVISHMMDKGAYLTIVSTISSGPILAERLIDQLNQTPTRQEDPYIGYSNMGYVPGGATGLLNLAQTPKQTVPYSLDNIAVWESAPLNLVSSVADFDLVLVITENPETARAWIEQVQPFLQINEKPMIMVVSAQAEPLVRPYYDGTPKQINGLIVGLPGGAAYESVTGQEGSARRSWDAFSLSVLVAELILVVGAVVGLSGFLMNSTKEED